MKPTQLLLCAGTLAAVTSVSSAAGAAPTKSDNLYLPAREVGNRQFFTPTGWHGASHYWKAGSLTVSAEDLGRPRGLNKPPRGYKALFNGKDLTNWQGLIEIKRRATLTPQQRTAEQAQADALMRQHWSVQDGILVFDGKGQSLQTVKDYGDFEMYVDWLILPKGDSGIYLRGNPQVQIWEATDPAAQVNGKFIGSGGLYNNQKNPSRPLVAADKPAGEWNTFWIKMVGDRVTIKLNDQLVVDNTPLENFWDRGQPLPAVGPIELQNHGNVLKFRNIFIRELK